MKLTFNWFDAISMPPNTPRTSAYTVRSGSVTTKASTLGVGAVLMASIGYHAIGGTDPQPRELLITAFLFITAPVSAHLLAKAGLHVRRPARVAAPGEAPRAPDDPVQL